ncbi:RimK family alpha-L-glutamate ligase [Candidatus Bathyarchaeota archaeon]|nr:RimK family alpha-L-glutamate ligase [Candidatus Bathyarchaeota archaeon]
MKVMILYGQSLSLNVRDLAEAAERLGHEVLLGSILNMSSYVDSEVSRFWLGTREVTDIDVCLLRSFGPGSCEELTRRISMVEHMEFAGIRVVNPCYPFRRARDKYATQYVLAKAGLPVARTFTTESIYRGYEMAKEFGESVYKPILGSRGYGSLKFSDPDLAFDAYKMLTRVGQPLVIQEYIPNPGRDIRVFVVGEEAVASAYKYRAGGTWKTNVAQGGRMVAEEVPEEVEKLGVEAVKALGLIYAGVDIIESERGPIILEVNGAPGWQALKSVSGVDIAEKIVEYICSQKPQVRDSRAPGSGKES